MDVTPAILTIAAALVMGWVFGHAWRNYQIRQLRRVCGELHEELKQRRGEWWQRGEEAPEYEE